METVFVVVQNHAQLRIVRTGERANGKVEILAGLDPGESVVGQGAGSARRAASNDQIMSVTRILIAVLIGAALGSALGYFGQCTSGTCPLTSTWWRGALYGGAMGLLFGLSAR